MPAIINSRVVACVGGALLALGFAATARADVMFHNVTDQPIHFAISCDGDGQDHWTVAPHGSRSLSCNNGSRVAVVEIVTDRGSEDAIVRYKVWDGETYRLGYDNDGDVNLWRM